jgi:hypothetical protein
MNGHTAFPPSLQRLHRRKAALGLWLLVGGVDLLHLLVQLMVGHAAS